MITVVRRTHDDNHQESPTRTRRLADARGPLLVGEGCDLCFPFITHEELRGGELAHLTRRRSGVKEFLADSSTICRVAARHVVPLRCTSIAASCMNILARTATDKKLFIASTAYFLWFLPPTLVTAGFSPMFLMEPTTDQTPFSFLAVRLIAMLYVMICPMLLTWGALVPWIWCKPKVVTRAKKHLAIAFFATAPLVLLLTMGFLRLIIAQ